MLPGDTFELSSVTGTGSYANLDGEWTATAGTTGTTLNFTAATGLTLTITGGTVNGIVQGVVYITDETTNELVAVSWYENQKRLVGLGYRNMSADAAQFGRTR